MKMESVASEFDWHRKKELTNNSAKVCKEVSELIRKSWLANPISHGHSPLDIPILMHLKVSKTN